jgi:transcription termination/antitermination protein NusG
MANGEDAQQVATVDTTEPVASDTDTEEPTALAAAFAAAETKAAVEVAETETETPIDEVEDDVVDADLAVEIESGATEAAPVTEPERDEAEDVDAVQVEEKPASPYDLPGSWFVIHSYSGYENKVKANLETRVRSMHLEDKVFDVVIPMEDFVEYKGGKKVTVQRKKFPGYVLVRMYLEDDTWYAVRNTPSVTGFVGSSTHPSPLSRREVERILGVEKEDGSKKDKPIFKPAWEVGETIRVVEGPFADFNGVIEDINVDQSKVRVLVDIFGRETPVELNFDQIVKY